MNLLPAYCAFDFLETLASLKIDLLDEQNLSDIKSKTELCQLVFKGLLAKIDKTPEEITALYAEKNCNPYLKALVKSGVKRIESSKEDFNLLKIDSEVLFKKISPFTQFFMPNSESSSVAQLEFSSGHLFYSLNNPATYQRINNFQVESFKFSEPKSWNFIADYKISHNSIIIADPYLLRDDKNLHVVELIKGLAPDTLNRKYWITIVVSQDCIKRFPDKAGEKLLERVEWVKRELKGFLQMDFELELLIYSKEDFHDRFLITNNFMIYSGYGFDLINAKGQSKKQTSWVYVNHTKVQEDLAGTDKTHFNIALDFISQLKKWTEKKELSSSTIMNPLLN